MAIKLLLTCFVVLMLANFSAVEGFYDWTGDQAEQVAQAIKKLKARAKAAELEAKNRKIFPFSSGRGSKFNDWGYAPTGAQDNAMDQARAQAQANAQVKIHVKAQAKAGGGQWCSDKQTEWISEESSVQLLPLQWIGCFAKGFQCRGDYCDDVKLIGACCLGYWDNGWYWTEFFSEENTAPTLCKRNYFVTGIQCKGSYCDQISLFCTKLQQKSWGDCSVGPSSWISEEGNGTYGVPNDGYYIVGAECSGAYCNNKRFYTCQLQ